MADPVSNLEIAWHLRQAKECLVNLHQADYFTESEWIALDDIIHKGKYVFTNGPPKSLLDGSPLLMYTDIQDSDKTDAEISIIGPLDESSGRDSGSHSDTASTPEVEESSGAEWEPVSEGQSPTESQENALNMEGLDHFEDPVEPEPEDEPEDIVKIDDLDQFEEPPQPEEEPIHTIEPAEKYEEFNHPPPKGPSGLSKSVYSLPQLDTISTPDSSKYNSYNDPESASYKDPYLGYVFLAAYSVQPESKLKVKANAGDKIQVTKLVAGTHYFGFNLTSGRKGQMTKEFIEDGTPFRKKDPRIEQTPPPSEPRAPVRHASNTIFDDIEETSADEWKHPSPATRPTQSTFKPSSSTGSASSATPDDFSRTRSLLSTTTVDSSSHSDTATQDNAEKMVITREQLDIMMEAKLVELLKAGKLKNSSFAVDVKTRSRSEQWENSSAPSRPHVDAAPKRKICGNWADPGRSCKYSADKCPDLHEFPTNWGQSPPQGQPQSQSQQHQHQDLDAQSSLAGDGNGNGDDVLSPMERSLKIQETCHFWSIPIKGCRYTATECKYLHEVLSPFSAAPPPPEPSYHYEEGAGETCWYWATPGRTCSLSDRDCKFEHRMTGKIAPMPPRLLKRSMGSGRRESAWDNVSMGERESPHLRYDDNESVTSLSGAAKPYEVASSWREASSTTMPPTTTRHDPDADVW